MISKNLQNSDGCIWNPAMLIHRTDPFFAAPTNNTTIIEKVAIPRQRNAGLCPFIIL